MGDFNGYIKLYRSLLVNPLWMQKPFSKGQAWADLLMKANFKDNQILFGFELITVKRGEHITSEVKLAERWGWSRQKVRNFLELLGKNKLNMLDVKQDSKKTVLKVFNYDDYQDVENSEKTFEKHQKDNEKTSIKHQKNTNNNDKNDKKEKKDKKPLNQKLEKKSIDANKLLCNLFEGEFKENSNLKPVLEKWFEYKQDRKESYKSELSIKALVRKVLAMSGKNYAKAEALVENAIANNWQGIFGSSDAKFLEQKRSELKNNKGLTLLEEAKKIISREDAIAFVYQNVFDKMNSAYLRGHYVSFGGLEWINFLFEKFEFDRKIIEKMFYEEIDKRNK